MKYAVSKIKLLQKSKRLEISFENGEHFQLPCAYLRMYSPAADNRKNSQGTDDPIHTEVNIIAIEAIGNYAVQFTFDDGYKNGIYSWDYLHELALKHRKIS